MGILIRRPYCTESHLDYFTRNITVCRGDLVATAHGDLGTPILTTGGSPATPGAYPLSVAQAKAHLRFTHSSEDDLVASWIAAAFQRIARDTGIAGLTSEWTIPINAFPSWRQPLRLPLWPVQAIDRLAYYTRDGVLTELWAGSPSVFLVDSGRPARVALGSDDDQWPTDLREFQPGTIELTAGFATADEYPEDLKQAARILIGQSNLFREQDVAATSLSKTSMDYDRWIEPWVLPLV